ncbi:hypothetical protein MLD52_21720 [Puniceicoccaceae bacterium K14]|nr:hypothetical protein [Puniceicoccaceae bacterium K14]
MKTVHPSVHVHNALNKIEVRLSALRIFGLTLWTGIARKFQKQQDAVRKEIGRECLEVETLISEYASDSVFTEFEKDDLIRKIQEIGEENRTGRIIPN